MMLREEMFLADRYEIIEQIGTGGMADVYKAKCHKLNRYVAIKVMKSEFSQDKTFVSKFWAEAQSAAGLTNPNVVNVYDVGVENGIYYIVMELVEGVTLKKYIEKRGKLPYKEAVSIAIQVANGMDAAHKHNIVHRDIKPQNIIISKEGKVKVTDIAKMPHLLIAGATGSGKSVCINTIIMSILYKAKPDEVKLIMIDPKVVELSVYNGIPHLMIPVVTDPKKAAGALNWAVSEMTDRYEKFANSGVREINGYNAMIDAMDGKDTEKPPKMPQIVIIVDELADLMMVASKDVEEAICRLAQLARAAGIHLIIATQRPSVNVITGLIKANMPSRIAFAVTSGVDSRTILDMNGAEKLLGKGDMLFDPQGVPKPLRVQGAFVSDKEVSDIVKFIIENNENAQYSNDVAQKMESLSNDTTNTTVTISDVENTDDGRDSYFAEAASIITDKERASIGMLQRYLKIGFNRAARIMDQLEEAGVVGPEEGTKPRKVLVTKEELDTILENN